MISNPFCDAREVVTQNFLVEAFAAKITNQTIVR